MLTKFSCDQVLLTKRLNITVNYMTSHQSHQSHDITSITSHHITSPHLTSHHITWHDITLHYITLHYIKLCDTKLGNIPWIEWHYIAKHCITFTTPPLISPCVAYLCVWVSVSESVCVRTWTRKHVLTDETQMIPAAWSQPGLNPRGEDRGGGEERKRERKVGVTVRHN